MIRSMTVRNFLGLSAMTFEFSDGGALIEGGNGRGKTTVLKAIKAALDGAGISPEAVRKGETAAEILIDLDHDSVREKVKRRIPVEGQSTLTVRDSNDSMRAKPGAFLSGLLGLALLDPLDLFLAKPGERRAMVLRAVPCEVKPEQIAPLLPDGFAVPNCAGHGLDVVDTVRATVAAERTETGRRMKDREREAKALDEAARVAEVAVPEMPAGGAPGAKARLDAATKAKADLDARATAAAKLEAFAIVQRGKAKALQEKAAEVRQGAPLTPTAEQIEEALEEERLKAEGVAAAMTAFDAACGEVERITALLADAQEARDVRSGELRQARQRHTDAGAVREMLSRREADAQTAHDKALELDAAAQAELATLTTLGADAPTDADKEAVGDELVLATRAVTVADQAERLVIAATAARTLAAEKTAEHNAAVLAHAALDRSVKALTNDLPRELLAGAAGLSGLTIEGDTILVDDGTGALVDVERLSTAAQMRFALTIAKRLNSKSKLLLVDGLERLDASHLGAFVQLAIEDGYQLFATRVTDGPLVVAPIGGGR